MISGVSIGSTNPHFNNERVSVRGVCFEGGIGVHIAALVISLICAIISLFQGGIAMLLGGAGAGIAEVIGEESSEMSLVAGFGAFIFLAAFLGIVGGIFAALKKKAGWILLAIAAAVTLMAGMGMQGGMGTGVNDGFLYAIAYGLASFLAFRSFKGSVAIPRQQAPFSSAFPQVVPNAMPLGDDTRQPGNWTCRSCKTKNAPENNFCYSCGGEKPKTACPQCGKENRPGMKFCPSCGAALADQDEVSGLGQRPADNQGYPEENLGQPVNVAASVSNKAKGMICLGLAVVAIISVMIFTHVGGRGKDTEIAKDYVVAEVDGEKIMRSQIERGLAELTDQAQDAQVASEDLPAMRKKVLDSIIIESAMQKEAKEKGIKVTDEEVQKIVSHIESQFATKEAFLQYMKQCGTDEKKMRQDVEARLAREKVLEGVVSGVVVSDGEIAKFYNSAKDRFFRRPTGYNVNFANFSTKEQAQSARLRILSGGKWDEVMGAASKETKNYTPYGKPTFVAEKDLTGPMRVLLDLPNNKVSPVIAVTSADIILVIKRSKSPERVLSLSEVKDEIRKQLVSKEQRALKEQFLGGLKTKISLNILDPAFFEVP
jgi:foldase protein PrsA